MRIGTAISYAGGFAESVADVVELEKAGLDVVFVPEAYSFDAVSQLGYLAAKTERVQLASGIFQIFTRTPTLTAMTAAGLDFVSDGRFILGLGASGPQVIEGLHGVAFGRPRTRLRETVEVVRMALAGEKVVYSGETVTIPLPGGEGRPMRLSGTPFPDVPIYLATLSPRMLRLTGEIADGWLGTSFVPEAAAAYLTDLDAGLASAGRTRADLDVCQGAEVAFAADDGELAGMVDARRPGLAFSLGGMGSATTNYYNAAYSRQGWGEVAARVRERWIDGDRAGAAALVTDEMVLATTLIGTEAMVRERLRIWAAAGVDTVRLYPAGETLDDQVSTLGRAVELVREVAPPVSAG
jgi:F420-dependent oxidoreductase-like protein